MDSRRKREKALSYRLAKQPPTWSSLRLGSPLASLFSNEWQRLIETPDGISERPGASRFVKPVSPVIKPDPTFTCHSRDVALHPHAWPGPRWAYASQRRIYRGYCQIDAIDLSRCVFLAAGRSLRSGQAVASRPSTIGGPAAKRPVVVGEWWP